jgi:hypothetical protein
MFTGSFHSVRLLWRSDDRSFFLSAVGYIAAGAVLAGQGDEFDDDDDGADGSGPLLQVTTANHYFEFIR